MRNDIFQNLTAITYPPGYMGTFLLNFLSNDERPVRKYSSVLGMQDNYEWKFNDVFDDFGGSNELSHIPELFTLIKKYSKKDLPKIFLSVILNCKYHLVKNFNGSFYVPKNEYSAKCMHIINDPFNTKYQIPIEEVLLNGHGVVKHHPGNIFDLIDNWKKQVVCVFPAEYSWIPYVLLNNKTVGHYIYNKNNLDSLFFQRVEAFKYHYYVSRDLDSCLRKMYQGTSSINYLDEKYYKFDIYNLVFNKNIDQIYDIDPNFKFDDTRKKMLDLAHETSTMLVNQFSLDYRQSFTDVNEIRSKILTAKP